MLAIVGVLALAGARPGSAADPEAEIPRLEEQLTGATAPKRRAEIAFRLATALAATGRLREAAERFGETASITGSPFREEALLRRAEALEASGRGREAAASLRTLIADHPSGRHTNAARYLLGRVAVENGDLGEAEQAFAEVARSGPAELRSPSAYMAAWAANATGRPDAAESHLVELLGRLDATSTAEDLLARETVSLFARVLRDRRSIAPLERAWPGGRPALADAVLLETADLADREGARELAEQAWRAWLERHADDARAAEIRRRLAPPETANAPNPTAPSPGSAEAREPTTDDPLAALEAAVDRGESSAAELLAAYVATASTDPARARGAAFRLGHARAAFAAGAYREASNRAGHLTTDRELGPELRASAEQVHAAATFRLAESDGSVALFEKVARLYPTADIGPAAMLRAAELRLPSEPTRAREWLEELLRRTEGDRRHATVRATAELELGRLEATRAAAVRLVVPLEDAVRRKRTALERATGHFERAAVGGDLPVALAARVGIGELHAGFADALLAAPTPEGLAEADRKRYREILEDRVRPYRETAAGAFRSALEQANGNEHGALAERARQGLERLAGQE